MDAKLKEYLDKWQSESLLQEKRTYTVKDFPVAPGEYIIYLKIERKITLQHLSETVVTRTRVYTFNQSKSLPDANLNPDGDIYIVKEHTKALYQQFVKDWNLKTDAMFQDIQPDDFFF